MRIVHVGVGPLGQRVLEELARRGAPELAGAVDPAPELAGRPLAEVVSGAPAHMRIAASLEELEGLGTARMALVTTGSSLPDCMESFRALLGRGIDVVSSCEELLWPWLRHPVLAQELHERAVRGGARILGTGVNPGFLMDALPLAVTAVVRELRALRVERVQDAGLRRLPFQRKVGAGLSVDEFEHALAAGRVGHVGLGESLHFLAHHLGLVLDGWEERCEPMLAERALACDLGPIPAGHVAGVQQLAVGRAGGEPRLELRFRAAVGEPEPHDRIVVEGDPPIDLVLRGGVHGDLATVAVLLHALDALRAAAPGLHTMASVPMLHGRARGAPAWGLR